MQEVPCCGLGSCNARSRRAGKLCQGACKPGSVPPTVSQGDRIGGGSHSSGPWIAPWLEQPTRASWGETPLPFGTRPLFGLAPGGVCHAGAVARTPVRSCRTLSPLPCPDQVRAIGGLLSVALSLYRKPKSPARRALPATLVSWSPDFPRHLRDAAARPPGTAPYRPARAHREAGVAVSCPRRRYWPAIRRATAGSATATPRSQRPPAEPARTATAARPRRFRHRMPRWSNAPD